MKFARRASLVLFGALAPLVVAETVLQLSSGFYRATLLATRREPIDPGAKRILCLGDSNTFGVRVVAGDSYPGQLETMLNSCAADGTRWQVLNQGIPGQNTAQIAAALPELLDWCQPSIVIVLAGLNNSWNEAGREGASWLDRSRLLRLARIALNNWRAGHAASPTVRDAEGATEIAAVKRKDPTTGESAAALRLRTVKDLTRIAAICRDGAGATPVLMTYAGQHPHSAPANDAARDTAAGLTPPGLLVDHDRAFREYVERYGYDAILFEDSHPAEAGYRLMARDVLAALIDAKRVAATLPADRFEPTEFRGEARIALERDANGQPARLLLEAEPGLAFQVYVSPVREPEVDLGTRTIPVGLHPWIEFCRKHPPFQGTLDLDGRATVVLPENMAVLKEGDVLHAAFVTIDPRALHDRAVRSISPPLTIAALPAR